MIDDRTMARTAFTVDETATIFSVDNQAEYDADFGPVENKLLVGLDYNRLSADGRYGYGAGPSLDIFDPDYSTPIVAPDIYQDGVQTIGQVGLYAQNQAKIADRLLLTFGGRQAWVDNEFEDRLDPARRPSQKDQAFTGKVGVGYLLDGGVTPYASYAESFTVNVGQGRSGDAYEPSKGKQYEVGVKYEPSFFPGYITAALFDLRKTNVLTTDPDDPSFQVQTGEVRHRGLELEANADLDFGFSMIATYTYLNAEITEDNDGFVGNRPSLVPEHQASLWVNYAFDERHAGRLEPRRRRALCRAELWRQRQHRFRVRLHACRCRAALPEGQLAGRPQRLEPVRQDLFLHLLPRSRLLLRRGPQDPGHAHGEFLTALAAPAVTANDPIDDLVEFVDHAFIHNAHGFAEPR